MENTKNPSDSTYKAIQFRKLVNLMNGSQAKHDREVGSGYASSLLPQEIKDALAALADDIPMLENLRAELEASNRVHNWNHSWRYHHSMLKEIDRLEGKGP